jgi:hypothetical protein
MNKPTIKVEETMAVWADRTVYSARVAVVGKASTVIRIMVSCFNNGRIDYAMHPTKAGSTPTILKRRGIADSGSVDSLLHALQQ